MYITEDEKKYLFIVNAHTIFNPAYVENFEYEHIEVKQSDTDSPISQIEKNAYHALQEALEELQALGAKPEDIAVNSAYRSYDDQKIAIKQIYNDKLIEFKNDEARTQQYVNDHCAKPGYSEHQTSLAVDIKILTQNLNVPEAIAKRYSSKQYEKALRFIVKRLVMEKHGFILTYPDNSRLEETTGMKDPEAWHWRYVGPKHARRIGMLRDMISTPEIVAREKVELEEYLKNEQKTNPYITDELIEKRVNGIAFKEVFLEDYINLLQLDITAESEDELLTKYAEHFIQNTLGYDLEDTLKA